MTPHKTYWQKKTDSYPNTVIFGRTCSRITSMHVEPASLRPESMPISPSWYRRASKSHPHTSRRIKSKKVAACVSCQNKASRKSQGCATPQHSSQLYPIFAMPGTILVSQEVLTIAEHHFHYCQCHCTHHNYPILRTHKACLRLT